MEFKDQIKQLGERVAKLKNQTLTEEATKNAFIMPFIQVLGYDVFNPTEVVPEFIADIGIKKGEKVDYAIMKDAHPIILIECKHWSDNLDPHNSQLFRYFHTTKAKFGILTNGIHFRFYTDLIESNKMDEKPFFEFKIDDMKDIQVEKLKEFHKASFNLDSINNTASELKYMNELRIQIIKELNEPSDDLTKMFTRCVYNGTITSKILEQFRIYVKKSFAQYLNDSINERLKSALDTQKKNEESEQVQKEPSVTEQKVITTAEELEAFYIVRAIFRSKVNINRIVHRDTQSYFGVLLDDNNRKPICRMHFNAKKKQLSFFDTGLEQRVDIESINDIYQHADRLLNVLNLYEKSDGKV